MTKLQFITISLGILALGMIYSYCFMNKHEEQPRRKHYEIESNTEDHKIKRSKYETWYGDTMLVTVDTTYFYNK